MAYGLTSVDEVGGVVGCVQLAPDGDPPPLLLDEK